MMDISTPHFDLSRIYFVNFVQARFQFVFQVAAMKEILPISGFVNMFSFLLLTVFTIVFYNNKISNIHISKLVTLISFFVML